MVKEEDYVTLDVAKILKGKGFNEPCFEVFTPKDPTKYVLSRRYPAETDEDLYHVADGFPLEEFLAPSLAQAAKWLREREQIYIRVDFLSDFSEGRYTPTITWNFKIFKLEEPDFLEDGGSYDTYEQALNSGIKEALKMI